MLSASEEVRGVKYNSPIVGVMDWEYLHKIEIESNRFDAKLALKYCVDKLQLKATHIEKKPI